MAKTNEKCKLGVLASGGGSNLQAIIDATKSGELDCAEVAVVISDKKNAYVLQRACNAGIDSYYLKFKDYNSKEDYDKKIVEILDLYKVDLVILAGYLKILTKELINVYKDKILNIHPGLLPAYGGVNMYGIKVHEAVIMAGAKQSGCTVHIVTEEVDRGPVLDEIRVDVKPEDTPESLAKRVLVCEHQLYPRAIKKYLTRIGEEL
jgi:phosphoribosylglycinamide formyltransferase-1